VRNTCRVGLKRRVASLTDREREVLVELARGLTNTEIGEQLHMSPATAKTHVSRLLAKLDARDRAQLVIVAYETGLVTPADRRYDPRHPSSEASRA
jgi:DNA-binding NarL/FixJ family response regulator